MPLSLRQILLLSTVLIQAMIAVPALFSLSDTIAKFCGYELLPRNERGIFDRYQIRQVLVRQEQEMRPMNDIEESEDSGYIGSDSGYQSSHESGRSRIRLQNQRALDRLA